MDQIECVVIGAGVVGLAVARALAARGREVIVLEAAEAIGTSTSSRNSEVIHAGLYYPRGSLKATLCVRGREMLYDYCAERHVAHARCGKLLVATAPAQIAQLDAILARGKENGVFDLTRISGSEALALEPALECVAAVYSPQTGIVDSHQLMLALQGDAERDGAVVALKSPVESIDASANGFVIRTGGDAPTEIRAASLVNSAGLQATRLAKRIRGLDPRHIPPLYLARGNYFSVTGRVLFRGSFTRCRTKRGWACISRSISAARRVSVPTWNGSSRSITTSIRAAPTVSTRRSAATGPRCPTARCSLRMQAFVRNSRDRASRPPTS